jgi:hypothetical protein
MCGKCKDFGDVHLFYMLNSAVRKQSMRKECSRLTVPLE